MKTDLPGKNSKDVVATAEKIVDSLRKNRENRPELTTSQIRKFLSAVNKIENRLLILENQQGKKLESLPDELVMEVKMLKAKLVYQSGRDDKGIVKDFLEKSEMLKRIDAIDNNVQEFREFVRFVEAIVAYHKFKGGKN